MPAAKDSARTPLGPKIQYTNLYGENVIQDPISLEGEGSSQQSIYIITWHCYKHMYDMTDNTTKYCCMTP